MNILVPCYSTAPDREHNAVVLTVTPGLLETLAANRRAFNLRALIDKDLYAHEYRGGPLHYLHLDEDDGYGSCLDSPGEPVALDEHLRELDLHGPWQLESAPNVYLKVVAEGFFYSWDGRTEKHGPSEVYETELFTLEQLAALCHNIYTRTPVDTATIISRRSP